MREVTEEHRVLWFKEKYKPFYTDGIYFKWSPKKAAAAAAKSLQLCPTLCDPMDGSPPGSPVPGILQARTLEWVAISFPNARKWKVKVKLLSHVRLLATPWTAAHQAPPSMGFSRQEYWSGVPLPSLSKKATIIFFFLIAIIFKCTPELERFVILNVTNTVSQGGRGKSKCFWLYLIQLLKWR